MGSNITKTKEIYLYIDRKDCALPKNGWLQPCYICDQVTVNTNFICNIYEKKHINICYSYMCKKCCRLYNKNIHINRKNLINDIVKIKNLKPEQIDYKPVEP